MLLRSVQWVQMNNGPDGHRRLRDCTSVAYQAWRPLDTAADNAEVGPFSREV